MAHSHLFHDASNALGEAEIGFQPTPVREVSDTLLPPNASTLEIILAKSVSSVFDVPVDIDTLWSADRCPEAFLPYLAWALNVDLWDAGWTAETKRKVIAATTRNHKKKGTVSAVKQALDAVGVSASIVEWFDMEPKGTPGTFEIQLLLRDDIETGNPEALGAERIKSALYLVDRVKRQSQHYTVSTGIQGSLAVSFAIGQGITSSVVQSGSLGFSHAAQASIAFALGSRISSIVFQKGEL